MDAVVITHFVGTFMWNVARVLIGRVAIVIILVRGVACTRATAALETPARLTTDSTAYTAKYLGGEGAYAMYGFRIVARFTNSGPDTLYLARCYPTSSTPTFGVELLDGADAAPPEGAAYNHFWACVGHDQQIAVAGGAARVDTLQMSGPSAWNGITHRPYGALTGRMRLTYVVLSCRGETPACRPSAALVGASNVFQVTKE